MKHKFKWNPPYPSTMVAEVVHWLGKPVKWPAPTPLSMPADLGPCLAVLLPIYDVAIRRSKSGDLFLFVDDLGGGFHVR